MRKRQQVCTYLPHISSANQGDVVISQAITNILSSTIPDYQQIPIQTHDHLSYHSWKHLARSRLSFLCGSNLLDSLLPFRRQWKFREIDFIFSPKIILFGVGWKSYDIKPSLYTKLLLRAILHPKALHSVRDNHTKSVLNELGFTNIINTSCPTLWRITPQLTNSLPSKKPDSVVTTLTSYRPNPPSDELMLSKLCQHYQNVYLWPQGDDDLHYFQSLSINKSSIKIVPSTILAYSRFLQNSSCDYIGTRLHGGIYALQHSKRSLIVATDNRATEISRDTGLPSISRQNISNDLNQFIYGSSYPQIRLDHDSINQFLQSIQSVIY